MELGAIKRRPERPRVPQPTAAIRWPNCLHHSKSGGPRGGLGRGRRAGSSESSTTEAQSAAPSAYTDDAASTTRQHLTTAPPPNAAKHRTVRLSLLRPPPSPMDADARTRAKHAAATSSRLGSSMPMQATHVMPYTHAHTLHYHTPCGMSSRISMRTRCSTHTSTHASTHGRAHRSHEHGRGEATAAASPR